MLGQVFKLPARLPLATEFAVDQGQPRAPGGGDPALLHKVLDRGFQLLEASLLPADGEHLEAKGTGRVFELQPLSNG